MFDYICSMWVCYGNFFFGNYIVQNIPTNTAACFTASITPCAAGSPSIQLFVDAQVSLSFPLLRSMVVQGFHVQNKSWRETTWARWTPAVLVALRFRIMTGYCKVGFHDSDWPPDVTNDGFRRTAVIFCCMGTPAPPNGPTCFLEFWGGWYVPSGPTPCKSHGTWWGLQIPFFLFEGLIFSVQTFFYLRNGFDFLLLTPVENLNTLALIWFCWQTTGSFNHWTTTLLPTAHIVFPFVFFSHFPWHT